MITIQLTLKGGKAVIVTVSNFYMIKDRFFYTVDDIYFNEVDNVVGMKLIKD